jgi:2'-5' RNA ligase
MRLFIALPLTKEMEETLGKLIFVLKQKGGQVKWVAPKNIHLTAKFLGEVDESKVPDIKNAIQMVAGKYPKVESSFDKIGGFPDLVRPRVIWAGLTGGVEAVQVIVDDLEEEMFKLGFAREDKRFKPHITLGRVKENYGLGDLVTYIKNYHVEPMTIELAHLVLFKSTLTPGGPIYERLFSAKFM